MTDVVELRAAAIFRGLGFYGDWSTDQSTVREQCLRAVALEDQALKEQGFVIVPREPSHAMIEVGLSAINDAQDSTTDSFETYSWNTEKGAYDAYKAMVDAALGNGGVDGE